MDSILETIKKLVGPSVDYGYFDVDLIVHINSTLMILKQLGVGPEEGFVIKDASALWTDFLPEGIQLELVKTYMYQKARLYFDPPQNASLLQAMKEDVKEAEWRLNVEVDPPYVKEG